MYKVEGKNGTKTFVNLPMMSTYCQIYPTRVGATLESTLKTSYSLQHETKYFFNYSKKAMRHLLPAGDFIHLMVHCVSL